MMMRQFFRGSLSLSLDVPSLVSFLFFWIGYDGFLRFLAFFHGFLEKKDDLSMKFTKFAMYRFCSVASVKKVISSYITTIYFEVSGKRKFLNSPSVRRNRIGLFVANRKSGNYRNYIFLLK